MVSIRKENVWLNIMEYMVSIIKTNVRLNVMEHMVGIRKMNVPVNIMEYIVNIRKENDRSNIMERAMKTRAIIAKGLRNSSIAKKRKIILVSYYLRLIVLGEFTTRTLIRRRT